MPWSIKACVQVGSGGLVFKEAAVGLKGFRFKSASCHGALEVHSEWQFLK